MQNNASENDLFKFDFDYAHSLLAAMTCCDKNGELKKEINENLNYIKSEIEKDINNLNINESDLAKINKLNELIENLESIKKFIKYSYSNESKIYKNPLDILNMGETTITELMGWLLDVNVANRKQKHIIDNIIKPFCTEFLKFIKRQEILDINEKRKDGCHLNKRQMILQKYSDIELVNIANSLTSSVKNKNNIDILLEDKNNNFKCIIENKKNAALSCTKNKEGRLITQLEKYVENNAKLIYLCADSDTVKKDKIVNHINIKGEQKEDLVIEDCDYKFWKDKPMSWLFDKLGYTVIEYSDIVLILWNIFKKNCPSKFKNDILIPDNNILETLKNLVTYKLLPENKDSYKFANFIINKKEYEDIKEYIKNEQIITYKNDIYGTILQNSSSNRDSRFDEFKHVTKKSEKITYRIIGNSKMRFSEMSKLTNDDNLTIVLLCYFIEYWELHNDIDDYKDNIAGYTKIIDGKYTYTICKELYESSYFDQLSDYVKRIILEMLYSYQREKISKLLIGLIENENCVYINYTKVNNRIIQCVNFFPKELWEKEQNILPKKFRSKTSMMWFRFEIGYDEINFSILLEKTSKKYKEKREAFMKKLEDLGMHCENDDLELSINTSITFKNIQSYNREDLIEKLNSKGFMNFRKRIETIYLDISKSSI